MFSLGEHLHNDCLSKAALEAFIDDRLENMRKRPGMYGPPVAVECECFLIIELFVRFCQGGDVEQISPLGERFIAFARQHFPKRPGPMLFSQWLTDTKYGCAEARRTTPGDSAHQHRAGQQIVAFFIVWKKELKRVHSEPVPGVQQP